MRLAEDERIEILIMLGCGNKSRSHREARDMFNEKYPNRPPISQSTVSRVASKWRTSRTIKDSVKSGRPGISEEKKINILLSLQEDSHSSSTQLGRDYDIHQTTVSKFLQKEKFHPYKPVFVQELLDDDPDRRDQFCEIMIELIDINARFVQRICFSDEATFCLNGQVNRQNYRYWAQENPHWFIENHTQYNEKVNVWAGIVENRIIGPFFFDESLTGERYLNFLRNDLVPALATLFPDDNDPDLPSLTLWFQQDGAPPHYAVHVREYLNTVFPERWIGRRGSIEWPPRSPDLNPLDFFLWGYVKNLVYKSKPMSVNTLKESIRQVIREISPQVVLNVQQEFLDRLIYCRTVGGGHFQHLIK
jgi:transposase